MKISFEVSSGAREVKRVIQQAAGIFSWRRRSDARLDRYNPLRGLNLATAIARLDAAQGGQYASIQWLYRLIERRDETLCALIDATNSALVEMEWQIKTCEGDLRRAAAWDEALAKEQAAALLEYWNRVQNVYDGITHLAMGRYRQYAHVQIRADGAPLDTWNPIEQWHVLRDGYAGDWYWNPDAQDTLPSSLPAESRMDPANYLIIETSRPINELALIKYLRATLCEKDWDAFCEIYGIPAWAVIMPPNIPQGKEAEYTAAAEAFCEGGSGALPNGASATACDSPRGSQPFSPRLEYLDRKLVLAGTGGQLTMLSSPTGIGQGASAEHAAVFRRIAAGRARMISEECQRKIDTPILRQLFPGRPALAYWVLDARRENDPGAVVQHVSQLATAGYRVDPGQITELSGYRVTLAPPSTTPPFTAPLQSRADNTPTAAPTSSAIEATTTLAQNATAIYASAVRKGLQPLAQAIWPLIDIEDPAALQAALDAVLARFPELSRQVLQDNTAADILQNTLAAAAANGIEQSAAARQAKESA